MKKGARNRQSGNSRQLRLIGGQWRGRRLQFPDQAGLRPTTDRVRETLFNWLAPYVHGAWCLDLFAGSGALGLEALSRGADGCTFVDTSAAAMTAIANHLVDLGAGNKGICHNQPAESFLSQSDESWDIVFVDPPFGLDLAMPALTSLAGTGRLHDQSLVYLETGKGESIHDLPTVFEVHREKVAGEVAYRLLRVSA